MKKLFQKWLFVFVFAAFLVTFGISWMIHSSLAQASAEKLLKDSLDVVARRVETTRKNLETITAMSNTAALVKAKALAMIIKENPAVLKDGEMLRQIRRKLDVDELHISNSDGVLIASLVYESDELQTDSYLNYNMADSRQSSEFLGAITDPDFELVQAPQPNGILKIMFQYAGVARLDQPGIVQIGYRPERIEEAARIADVENIASEFQIGMNGTLQIVPNEEFPPDYQELAYTADGISLSIACEGYILTATLPRSEMYLSRNSVARILIAANLLLFLVIFFLISWLLQKVVINGIYKVNNSLDEITRGNLDVQVKVATTSEFEVLSRGINTTVSALKKAIEVEARRIDAELEMGQKIQTSVLPTNFPDEATHQIHAGMFTAREVGGDFYDFFDIDENRMALLVADVSGKGLTAALYMMTAKTLLKELLQNAPLEDAFRLANQELCRNNAAQMFLTVFCCIWDKRTNVFSCVNAGHNPPVIRYADGHVAYLKLKPSLPLSVLECTKYPVSQITFERGDTICLYSDGITEAMNTARELFGEERLLKTVEAHGDNPETLVKEIRRKTVEFAGSAPQSDDMTILVLKLKAL